jgi:hypothetical protein
VTGIDTKEDLEISAAVTVSLIPFALLVAYVSRLATLSQSTLFLGPFVAGGPHGHAPDRDE